MVLHVCRGLQTFDTTTIRTGFCDLFAVSDGRRRGSSDTDSRRRIEDGSWPIREGCKPERAGMIYKTGSCRTEVPSASVKIPLPIIS
jgi:hypothetical protein